VSVKQTVRVRDVMNCVVRLSSAQLEKHLHLVWWRVVGRSTSMHRQTDTLNQAVSQSDKQADRQSGRQTDKGKDRYIIIHTSRLDYSINEQD
jgi:hypothetical protein